MRRRLSSGHRPGGERRSSTKAPRILTPLGMLITEARGRRAHTFVSELYSRLRSRATEREAIMHKDDVVGRSGTFVDMIASSVGI
ncbi:hypothetical protein BHM03_00058511 [Ensete ventricosum]|nr:hypothetical protein BHM03_00058511 [Ensete ventricosum]